MTSAVLVEDPVLAYMSDFTQVLPFGQGDEVVMALTTDTVMLGLGEGKLLHPVPIAVDGLEKNVSWFVLLRIPITRSAQA